jgi:hypothetical protein
MSPSRIFFGSVVSTFGRATVGLNHQSISTGDNLLIQCLTGFYSQYKMSKPVVSPARPPHRVSLYEELTSFQTSPIASSSRSY